MGEPELKILFAQLSNAFCLYFPKVYGFILVLSDSRRAAYLAPRPGRAWPAEPEHGHHFCQAVYIRHIRSSL